MTRRHGRLGEGDGAHATSLSLALVKGLKGTLQAVGTPLDQ